MASRFNQRDNRSSLFSSYDAQTKSRPSSASPGPSRQPQSSSSYGYSPNTTGAFGAYPHQHQHHHHHHHHHHSNGSSPLVGSSYPQSLHERPSSSASSSRPGGGGGGGAAAAAASSAYNNASVLDSLESQNDEQVSEMSKRVAMLKDITMRIGDEIRDSTALAEKMNDGFGSTGLRLKGTMNRMLRMAERTGVGWRVWLGFFAAVILLFWYVWLF